MSRHHAIVLAAGLGLRLRSVVDDRPKGLIAFGGDSLVARSIRLLREAGVQRTTIVVGYLADQYRAQFSGTPGVDFIENADYASTGSMASLALALANPDGPVIVLESDILYERRALAAVLAAEGSATVVSGMTGAGDEVWVDAADGRLRFMSKQRDSVPGVLGEFVGITTLSAADAKTLRAIFQEFAAREGHGRMAYDTDALVELARRVPVGVVHLPDLVWGEIDDDAQYRRAASVVWPAVK